jgi:hypothetical protein
VPKGLDYLRRGLTCIFWAASNRWTSQPGSRLRVFFVSRDFTGTDLT